METEALMRGMGVWLLVCTWVSLGVLAPGEGEGEVTHDCEVVWGALQGQGCPLSNSTGDSVARSPAQPLYQGPSPPPHPRSPSPALEGFSYLPSGLPSQDVGC